MTMNRTELNCEEVRQQLNAYVDSELTGERLASMDSHLSACAACSADLSARSAMKRRLHDAVAAQPGNPALEARIRAALREETAPRWWFDWKPQFVAAAAVL